MTAPTSRRSGRAVLVGALVLALAVQLVVLYAPSEPGTQPFPNADKVVHLTVFLVPTLLALAAGVRWPWVVGLLAGHAVLSEVVQGTLLPSRDGNVPDALADLAGVAVGALVALAAARRRPRRGPS